MTQPPLWDGTGIDPWLPARLAHETRIAQAERRLFSSWWASFSAWIVGVRRNVLSGVVPDPQSVWSAEPDWTDRMREFVAGPVKDTMGLAYETLFGQGYHFDNRPAVTNHLIQVTNRMVRTPEAVFTAVASTVARGAGEGMSIPDIAANIEDVLSVTGNETWRNRGVVVARTETIGALNGGSADAHVAVAEVLGGDFENQWLATLDARVRHDHLIADGQRVPIGTPFTVGGESLMFPGDPTCSARQRIQCRCSMLLVQPGETVDQTGRGFSDADDWWASQIAQAE